MRGATTVTVQILAAAAALAALGGLIGLLVVEFATSKSAATGLGWGMVAAGAVAGFAVGNSGSPSENRYRGRFINAGVGAYWGPSAALPQSPLQIALGGILAFGAGVAVLLLFAY